MIASLFKVAGRQTGGEQDAPAGDDAHEFRFLAEPQPQGANEQEL